MLLTSSLKTRLAAVLFLSLATLFPQPSFPSTIGAILPTQGLEGDLISIQGSGFGNNPLNHAVVIHQNGEMIAVDVLNVTPNELICRIAGVDQPMTGDVFVYQGARTLYPDWDMTAVDRTYLVHESSWFETTTAPSATPQSKVLGPSPLSFTAIGAGSATQAQQTPWYLRFTLVLDDFTIANAEVEIVTCGDLETGPSNGGEGRNDLFLQSGPSSIQARLSLQPTNGRAAGQWHTYLAEDLASALNQNFGSKGLNAVAIDPATLQVSFSDWAAIPCGLLKIVPHDSESPPEAHAAYLSH